MPHDALPPDPPNPPGPPEPSDTPMDENQPRHTVNDQNEPTVDARSSATDGTPGMPPPPNKPPAKPPPPDDGCPLPPEFEGDGESKPLYAGRYRLIRGLGYGTFGLVAEAFDTVMLRRVALKMPRPDKKLTQSRRAMFLAEARKVAALDHPNVVKIYDAVADANYCYLSCELIDGGSLAKKLEKERLAFEDTARIIAGVAQGLHAAHCRDIVHRDVKPGNILLRKDGTPCVSDFGLAITELEQLKEGPDTFGTVAYMSPEQARGESNKVDARSDIYSLGVVLFVMLTNRLPFVAENSTEYCKQIISRPIRPLRTINDQIPAELEDICLKCVHKESDKRYRTAKDVADALTEWLKPKPEPEPPRAPLRPRLRLAAGAAGVASIVAVALFSFLTSGSSPPPEVIGHWDEVKANIKPDFWYSMLDWKPKELTSLPPPSKLDWVQGKPMLIYSTKSSLIVLGTAKRPGYAIQVTIRQEQWHGNFGIFLGYHEGRDKGGPYCRYQLFKFASTVLANGDKGISLQHCLATDYDFRMLGRPLSVRGFSAVNLKLPGAKFCKFSCIVDENGVHSVTWDDGREGGPALKLFGTKDVNAKLKEHSAALDGDFGIQTLDGSTLIGDFEVQFSESYCQNKKNR